MVPTSESSPVLLQCWSKTTYTTLTPALSSYTLRTLSSVTNKSVVVTLDIKRPTALFTTDTHVYIGLKSGDLVVFVEGVLVETLALHKTAITSVAVIDSTLLTSSLAGVIHHSALDGTVIRYAIVTFI